MWVVNNRKFFYGLSILLVVASLVALFGWGLRPGIDFTGGTLVQVSYEGARPDQASVAREISAIDANASIRPSGDTDYIVRMKEVTPAEKDTVMRALSVGGTVETTLKTFDSIGPLLGSEALRKAYWSLALVIIGIILYITFAFRKVSEPVSSWKYGLTAIVALVHDVIIPTGIFAILGRTAGYEVDTLFVTALLVVLGSSVHNTIVVFDRVRENLKDGVGRSSFAQIVGSSIRQTMARSINTSLTTLTALVILYFLGGQITQNFVLVMAIGLIAGTYSSVFIGPPLLVTMDNWQKRKGKK